MERDNVLWKRAESWANSGDPISTLKSCKIEASKINKSDCMEVKEQVDKRKVETAFKLK
jgi:hypothetical protein